MHLYPGFPAALWLVHTVYAAGLACNTTCAGIPPIAPKQDPWYTAPAGFEATAPGTLLRVRPAPGNLTCVVSNSSAAFNVLFRTTDSHYKPTWAVTTLFVPLQTNGSALLSYQIPYDSADLNASPSFALYRSPPGDIAKALGLGWFVSVPDYEGPLASFTAGVISGHATIDSIRAVKASFGLQPDAKYAMWGYSGGALASEWAAELAVQYASEMTFAGAALGGLTPNVTSVLYSVNGALAAGLIPHSFLGLASQWPDVKAYLVSQLKTDGPYNKTGFLQAYNKSLAEASLVFAGQDISRYFILPNFTWAQNPTVQRAINRDGMMGYHGVPSMPLFVYKAIGDQVSRVQDTDILVERYCAVGANITYQRNMVGGHSAEATNGDGRAVAFLSKVLSGHYEKNGCLVEDVRVNITSSPLRKRWWGAELDV